MHLFLNPLKYVYDANNMHTNLNVVISGRSLRIVGILRQESPRIPIFHEPVRFQTISSTFRSVSPFRVEMLFWLSFYCIFFTTLIYLNKCDVQVWMSILNVFRRVTIAKCYLIFFCICSSSEWYYVWRHFALHVRVHPELVCRKQEVTNY